MFNRLNSILKPVIIFIIILMGICLHTQLLYAIDRVTKPEIDWAQDAKVDFCADSSAFDYRNAYWMGALSYYSYWHLRYTDKLYKAQPGAPVEINFKNEINKDGVEIIPEGPVSSIFKGLGFGTLRSTYFSSSKLKPESGHNYSNLVRRWFPPLPGEACIKPEMYYCYGPAVSHTRVTPDLVAKCGENSEKSFMEVQRLQRIQDLVNGKLLSKREETQAINDKNRIEGLVKQYEELKHVHVGLDWQDPNLSQRCEQIKTRDDQMSDTQAAIYESESAITIVFRGTERDNSYDIATDLAMDLVVRSQLDLSESNKSLGRVHEGFYRAVYVMGDWVKQELGEIRKLRPQSITKPIFITGHSLGGALANIVMYQLLEFNEGSINKEGFYPFNLKALYSFGSPRVGDGIWTLRFKELADKMSVGLYRIVNNNDLVPHVPCGDYTHVGALVYMDSTGNTPSLGDRAVHVLVNPIDTLLSIGSLYSSFSACGFESIFSVGPKSIRAMVTDHFMPSYYKDLAKLRLELNKKFEIAQVKALVRRDATAVAELQYPLNCRKNSSAPILDGAMGLNYQRLDNKIEEDYLVY